MVTSNAIVVSRPAARTLVLQPLGKLNFESCLLLNDAGFPPEEPALDIGQMKGRV